MPRASEMGGGWCPPCAAINVKLYARATVVRQLTRPRKQVEGGGRRKAIGTALATGFGIAAGLQVIASLAGRGFGSWMPA